MKFKVGDIVVYTGFNVGHAYSTMLGVFLGIPRDIYDEPVGIVHWHCCKLPTVFVLESIRHATPEEVEHYTLMTLTQ